MPVKTTRFREYQHNCSAVKDFQILDPVDFSKEIEIPKCLKLPPRAVGRSENLGMPVVIRWA